MRSGKRQAQNKDNETDILIDKAEKLKTGIRSKVEYPFRVIKHKFGFLKVRYHGLKKYTRQLIKLFAAIAKKANIILMHQRHRQ
jgi:transposase, IS5 family